MCEGTVVGDGKLIELNEIHESIRSIYNKGVDVDRCIYEEVKHLLQNGVATIGHSCCGHNVWRSQAFIHGSSIKDATRLGYKVYKFRDNSWEDGRYENLILLKTGSVDEPIMYGSYEVRPVFRRP